MSPRTPATSSQARALVARAVEFERDNGLAASDRIDEVPLGIWQRSSAHPAMWVLNQLHVVAPQPSLTADALISELDRELGEAAHRRVQIADDATGRRLAAEFSERPGWQVGAILVMTLTGKPPAPPAGTVREVDEPALRALEIEIAQDDHELREDEATVVTEGRAALRAAVPGVRRFVGAREGVDACSATLYADGATAQPESVGTLRAHRGHGLAGAVVSASARAALDDGHDLVFILCEADDGPVGLYARLGFSPLGRYWTFTRSSPPAPSRRPPA